MPRMVDSKKRRAGIRKEFAGVVINLGNGPKLLFFRPVGSRFYYSLHQVVLLLVVGVLVAVILDYLANRPNPQFNANAFSGEALSLAGVLLVAYLLAVTQRDKAAALRFLVQLHSVAPFAYAIDILLAQMEPENVAVDWAIYLATLVWFLAVVAFLLHVVSGRLPLRTGLYTGSYIAAVVVPPFFLWSGDYWYPRVDEQRASIAPPINQEQLYYAQPGRVDAAIRKLAPGRPGVVDVYFVGFGGYGSEDVFMKEVRFAQGVFDRHFDTVGRSVALINNPATLDEVPLATVSNLRQVLNHIGAIMNQDEDILVLFITTHGAETHELAVQLRSLRLNDIKPADLKAALDAAHISWRVLMISACYAGGFVEPLKDERTLIATAAAADKQSFGCSNESEFTYFGKAVLAEQLTIERHLPTAFANAADAIKAREAAEGKEPSNPRLFVGGAIAPKLRHLAEQLQAARN